MRTIISLILTLLCVGAAGSIVVPFTIGISAYLIQSGHDI